MRVNDITSTTADFFKRNAGKWACFGLTAFVLASPVKAEAKSEIETPATPTSPIEMEYTDEKKVNEPKFIEETTDITKNVATIEVLNSAETEEDIETIIENLQADLMQYLEANDSDEQSETSFIYYDKWEQDETGRYIRIVSSIEPKPEYFVHHDYTEFLSDIKNNKIGDVVNFTELRKEVSKEKPETYDYVFLEIGDDNLTIASKVSRNTEYTELSKALFTVGIGFIIGAVLWKIYYKMHYRY